MLYKFADNANTIRIVHRLVKEIAVELDHVGVILRLEKLHGFFLLTGLERGMGGLTLYSLSLSRVLASTSFRA